MTTRWRWSPRRKCAPAAWPTRSAVSAVIGSMLVVPRMPSVPKNLRVMRRALARLTDPAPDSRRNGVGPSCDQEQQGAAKQCNGSWISQATREGHEGGLSRPVMPVLAHLRRLLAVLHEGSDEGQENDSAVKNDALELPDDHHVHACPHGEAPHHGMPRYREDPPGTASRTASADQRG